MWYELLSGSWPFKGFPAESIIWQAGSGKKQNFSQLQGGKDVKVGVTVFFVRYMIVVTNKVSSVYVLFFFFFFFFFVLTRIHSFLGFFLFKIF